MVRMTLNRKYPKGPLWLIFWYLLYSLSSILVYYSVTFCGAAVLKHVDRKTLVKCGWRYKGRITVYSHLETRKFFIHKPLIGNNLPDTNRFDYQITIEVKSCFAKVPPWNWVWEIKIVFVVVSEKGCRAISVITGRGNNSRGGKARIKPAILEYLKKNNYK